MTRQPEAEANNYRIVGMRVRCPHCGRESWLGFLANQLWDQLDNANRQDLVHDPETWMADWWRLMDSFAGS